MRKCLTNFNRILFGAVQKRARMHLLFSTSPGLAALLRSDGFFSGAVCFVRRTHARSAFHGFSIGFKRSKKRVNLVDLVKSFQTSILNLLFETDSYSNEYLVPTCKIWFRYSRERASQSMPTISQKLEEKLEQT